jgi:ABC-type transport system involved in multi-copper enzyme maturation permease subunit
MSRRRITAIARKELREYRHNRNVIVTMAVIPVIFAIQPLVAVLGIAESTVLAHEHVLLYMLGIPTLVPLFVAAYAIAGERQQATLEPVLTTPISREELLLGKAIAAFVPALIVSYAVFLAFVGVVVVFAHPGIPAAVLRASDLLAQLIYTPLLVGWSIWVAMAISTRSTDVRVAQQLSLLASIPPVIVTVLIALNVIEASIGLAAGALVMLLLLNWLGWRVAARLFVRERLITGSH